MRTWFVASGNPGTRSFLQHGVVAVDFHIRADVSHLSAGDMRGLVGATNSESAHAATRTRFANQLDLFASHIAIGDHVVTFDRSRRATIIVGVVTGDYRYETGPTIESHPHVRSVDWLGTIERAELPDRGTSIPRTPGVTVAELHGAGFEPRRALPSAAGRPRPRPATSAPRAPRLGTDGFTWDPPTGAHRLRLVQTFGREGPPMRPFVVVMLNPAANEMPGYLRSTTCHRVRAWGERHGYDGAVYVNLFTIIEPQSTQLAALPVDELNGYGADEAIKVVSRDAVGPVIAGWGALPAGFDGARYRRRVAEVRALIDGDLHCLGLTAGGYPKHGRTWLPDDELVPLP